MEDVNLVHNIPNLMRKEENVNLLNARKLNSSTQMDFAMTALMELLPLQMEHSACGQAKEVSSKKMNRNFYQKKKLRVFILMRIEMFCNCSQELMQKSIYLEY